MRQYQSHVVRRQVRTQEITPAGQAIGKVYSLTQPGKDIQWHPTVDRRAVRLLAGRQAAGRSGVDTHARRSAGEARPGHRVEPEKTRWQMTYLENRQRYYEGQSRTLPNGDRKYRVFVWSDQGAQFLGRPVAPEMMPPLRPQSYGFRWGEQAGSELEAGAELLAFALILDATNDKHKALAHYRYVARLMIYDLADYWLMTSANILDFIERLEDAAGTAIVNSEF